MVLGLGLTHKRKTRNYTTTTKYTLPPLGSMMEGWAEDGIWIINLFSSISSYGVFANTPIVAIDLFGDSVWLYTATLPSDHW